MKLNTLPVGTVVPCDSSQTMRPSQRLHLINLGVRDLQRSAAFYQKLGWKPSPTGHEGFYKFDLGGYALGLLPLKDVAADVNEPVPPRVAFSGTVFVHLVQTPEAVAQVLAKAVEAGGTLVKPATRTPWGLAGFFADPDGYLFEVDYEEVWVFHESGTLVVDELHPRTY